MDMQSGGLRAEDCGDGNVNTTHVEWNSMDKPKLENR